mgnify:FL=1
MNAQTIADKIVELMRPLELDPSLCVGQGYDGASVMAGKDGGVQKLIKDVGYHSAVYVHCASRRLNLVLSSTAEHYPEVKAFFDTLDLLHNFMSGSKRHAAFLEMQKAHYPNAPPLELVHSCDTRWSSRSLEVEKVLRRFDCILDTLELFEDDADAETKLAASSLLLHIQTMKFVTFLVFLADCTSSVNSVQRLCRVQKQMLQHALV